MKQEILNRLLIDRSLGALAPDVAALLEAYLEREPADSEAAAEIEESVRLARKALEGGPAVQLPPLKMLPLPEQPPAEHRRRRAWWPAELAAALVLGIGLGFLAFHPGEPAQVRSHLTDGFGWGEAPDEPLPFLTKNGSRGRSPHLSGISEMRSKLQPRAATVRVETADSAPPDAFWSVKRLARMEPKTASTRGPRVTWNSLLQYNQANN